MMALAGSFATTSSVAAPSRSYVASSNRNLVATTPSSFAPKIFARFDLFNILHFKTSVYKFAKSNILYGPKLKKNRRNSKKKSASTIAKAGTRAPASVEGGVTPEEIESKLRSMTLQQKVGQLLLVGFMGTESNYSLDKVIDAVHPGGIVVFSRNIKTARQISTLTIDAQKRSIKSSTLPLFVAVDQEGGDVLRVRTAMPLPSALSLGDTNNSKLLDEAGHETGILLKTLGFNMNLAPVLDISDPTEKTFIGTRTFGSDPARVSEMGTHFASGLEQAGVLSTAKHFPGHGGIRGDSHKETPEVDATMKEMIKNDLSPFAAMEEKMGDHWAVMLAHVSYPKLDPTGTPATFSKPIVTGILRKQMGFNGLIITDDIEMAGAEAIKDTHERALKAIEAGADMIMVAWNKRLQSEIAGSLLRAVKTGKLPESRVDESIRRIIAFKARYSTMDPHVPTDDELRFAVQNPKLEEIGQEVVRSKFARLDHAVTPAGDHASEGKPVYVFTASDRFYQTFRTALTERKSRHYHLGEDKSVDIDRVLRVNPDALGLLYVSGPRIARIASTITPEIAKRIVVVNVETEGAVKNAMDFRLIADIYYRHPNLGSLTATHLFNLQTIAAPVMKTEMSSSKNQVDESAAITATKHSARQMATSRTASKIRSSAAPTHQKSAAPAQPE